MNILSRIKVNKSDLQPKKSEKNVIDPIMEEIRNEEIHEKEKEGHTSRDL